MTNPKSQNIAKIFNNYYSTELRLSLINKKAYKNTPENQQLKYSP